ncbi:MAG: hypothetical protein GYB31_13165 [Bacteroidetes bacterium]|nr:hypothetical protein [Bacteroidota bacterium]
MPEAKHIPLIKETGENNWFFLLFCCYVFLAPFEDLLEYLYGIKTVFKPYRLFGIIILLTGFFKDFSKKPFFVFKYDLYITLFLVYGIVYTIFLYSIGNSIGFGNFVSTQLQTVFLFLILLTFKRMDFTYRQMQIILWCMVAGIFINSLIIVLDFYVLHLSSREKGLSDNPNYAAYGMVIAANYLLYHVMKNKFKIFSVKNLIFIAMIIILFFTILATGSRGGFLLFLGSFFLMLFVLSSTKAKRQMLPMVGVLLLLLVNTPQFQTLTSKATTFNRLKGATQDIRIPLAQAGFNAIEDSGGMGVGVAQMLHRPTFAKYIAPVDRNLVYAIEVRDKGLSLHNLYIEVMAETGFIGLGLMLFYFYQIFKFQWQNFRRNLAYQGFHQFALVSFICLLVFGIGGKGLLGALFWFVITYCSKVFLPDYRPFSKPTIEVEK